VLYSATINSDGTANIPVNLLTTPGDSDTPDGGLNHFVAVQSDGPYAVDQPVSQTSNPLIVRQAPAVEASVAAVMDAAEPGTPGQFEVTLADTSPVDTVLSYTLTGTATEGVDFIALPDEVEIPAGMQTATIDIAPIADDLVEGPETVTVELTGVVSGDGLTVLADNPTATLEIADEILPPFEAAIVVDTAEDENDWDYSLGDLSLREAVLLANAAPGADTVTFDASVFSGGAASLIRLTQGQIEITGETTIDGSTGMEIVITGDANGDDMLVAGTNLTDVAASGAENLADNTRLFLLTGPDADTTFNSLTLTGGRTTEEGEHGGAIRADDADVTLMNGTISGNSTARENAYGGGLYAEVMATLTNSTVSGNSTAGQFAGGGGLYARTATLTNSTISGNSTEGNNAFGGGIYASTATLTNSTVSGNSTAEDDARGGGLFARDTVTLTNSTVSGNSTAGDDARGGGLYAETATLTNSTISGNSTEGFSADGGGLYAEVMATLTNSTISGNSAEGNNARGGGLHASTATLTNSTVSGNRTEGGNAKGGGLFAVNIAMLTLTNSIVLGNNSARTDDNEIGIGGALGAVPSFTDQNFTGQNIVGATMQAFDATSLPNVSNADPASVFAATVEINPDGSAESGDEFVAGALADNGGPVQTIALKADLSNPALDAGDDTALDEATVGRDLNGDGDQDDVIDTDARGAGFPRIVDQGAVANNGENAVDLGAFEAAFEAALAPIEAVDDMAGITEEGGTVTVPVLGNDIGMGLTVTGVGAAGTGTASLADGAVSYTLAPGLFDQLAAGQVATDRFTYALTDMAGQTDSATVTVMITGQNDAPSADDESAVVPEDGPAIAIDVLTGDGDIDFGNVLSVASVSPDADGDGVAGLVTVTPDGTVSYDPNGQFESLAAGESAADQFTYLVNDGNGGVDQATVTVTILGEDEAAPPDGGDGDGDDGGPAPAPNQSPLARPDQAILSVLAGPSDLFVLMNDMDPDGDVLEIAAATLGGQPGRIEIAGDDALLTFDPMGAFPDLFAGQSTTVTAAYTVSDGKGGTDTATVEITVTGAGTPPLPTPGPAPGPNPAPDPDPGPDPAPEPDPRELAGTTGDDTLTVPDTDVPTTVDAMGGEDTVVLPLDLDTTLITPLPGGGFRFTPVDAEGLATGQPVEVTGAERFVFDAEGDGADDDDATLILDTSEEAQAVTLFYQVYFARLGDAAGVSFWGGFLEEALLSLGEVSDLFPESPEFTEAFGADLTNKEYVEQLYDNSFGRHADPAGCAFWAGLIDLHDETGGAAGLDRGDVGLAFAQSEEIGTIFGSFIDQGVLAFA